MTRNLIAMEVSPTKEESKGWTLEQWNWFAHRFIEEMDDETAKRKAEEQNARKAYAEQHHFTCEPIHADTKKEHFEFVLEEVMEISLCVFFEIMSVPGGSGYSSGGGGGNNNDQPHKKKDDDDELLRAKRIARAVAKCCP